MRATGDRDRRPSPFPRPDNAPRRAPVIRNKTARRRRLIGASSAVVVAGVVTMGFLGGGTATADPSAGEVVFNGKCGLLGVGLGNESTPKPGTLTVETGDKVTFTNKLGTDATLHFGGTEYEVEEDASKTVPLKYATEVMMSPHCAIMPEDRSESMVVKVEPKQDDSNGGGSDDGGDSGGGDSGDGGGSDEGDNDSTAGEGMNGDKPDDGKKPTKSKADGKAGDATKDDAEEQDGAAGTDGGDSSGSDAVEKVDTAAKSNTETSASALLAALAALCLAGVGFAALRTYMSSRGAASA